MASFTVEAAQRQDRMLPNGDTKQVYVVWLKTDRGASGQVTVPSSVWEGDELGSYLQAEADKLDKAFVLVNQV